MKLVIFEDDSYSNFFPLVYPRPIFELRCGASSLAAKIERQVGQKADAYLCRDYLVETFSLRAGGAKVNDLSGIKPGEEVLFVNGRILAKSDWKFSPELGVFGCHGKIGWWRTKADVTKLKNFADLLAAAGTERQKACGAKCFEYMWEVMLENPHVIVDDFKAAGKSGVQSPLRPDVAVYGDKSALAISEGVEIQPFVCLDTRNGPITIESGTEIHPFTRIEGPCYVGPKCTLLGAKIREGCSFGPVCRVGGEVEESVIHGYSNKYHDGFLGHAYVCEWVNLGALTTNSDLKNDYGSVEVHVNGGLVSTGSTKVGSMIGDHVKTSICTLLNTGSVVGTFALLMAIGKPLPKFIPPFAWYLEGVISKGFGKKSLFETAKIAMSRRKKEWTEADLRLYEKVAQITEEERMVYIRKGRKQLAAR
jgi:UDP-N-acetylglucosamine diphosphorylase/glucosamine-1-phosphate N-acetyltransferase